MKRVNMLAAVGLLALCLAGCKTETEKAQEKVDDGRAHLAAADNLRPIINQDYGRFVDGYLTVTEKRQLRDNLRLFIHHNQSALDKCSAKRVKCTGMDGVITNTNKAKQWLVNVETDIASSNPGNKQGDKMTIHRSEWKRLQGIIDEKESSWQAGKMSFQEKVAFADQIRIYLGHADALIKASKDPKGKKSLIEDRNQKKFALTILESDINLERQKQASDGVSQPYDQVVELDSLSESV